MTQQQGGRVGIVGGGVAGLAAARVLKADGFDVTLFERESTVGGVWAASRAYPGLRTNNPRETYAFSDFAYPETADEFPTAGQVRDYLEAYAAHFGLWPCLRLSTEVVSVSRRKAAGSGRGQGFEVRVRPTQTPATAETHTFDFLVVCNGVFSEPYRPRIDGEERFTGRLLHSSQVSGSDVIRGKHIVIVGAGKSALDCAAFAGQEAESCTLVFRSPHWVLPRYFGHARVDRMLFTRAGELTLPAYYRASRTERAIRWLCAPLLWLIRHGTSRLVVRLTGMPNQMVPDRPFHSGVENIGIGEAVYQVLRSGQAHARRARIARFTGPDTVELDSGEQLHADVVIFATGWQQSLPFLDAELRHATEEQGGFRLYRHILPPGEPRLGFIGYASSANSPLTSELAAHWLSQCFLGKLALPSKEAMEREVTRVRRWTARVLPKRPEGYFIGGYVAHYADELLRDMGLSTRRTRGILAEYFAPLWAERYEGLSQERRRKA